jgi:hypothetical protein
MELKKARKKEKEKGTFVSRVPRARRALSSFPGIII